MNTLKLKLVAASLFACSAAFAQTTPASSGLSSAGRDQSKAAAPATATVSRMANSFTAAPIDNRANYRVDAYVLQNGMSQYASQFQDGYSNTADIYQNRANAAGANSNNATQYQSNDGRDGSVGARNTVYIEQNGSNSNAAQKQVGTGSVATIVQGTGNKNNATQYQNGMNNSAAISQAGSNDNAIQYQLGDNDIATIVQGTTSGHYAEQRQFGGNGNQASTTQTTDQRAFSYTEQNGSSNTAIVNQVYSRSNQLTQQAATR